MVPHYSRSGGLRVSSELRLTLLQELLQASYASSLILCVSSDRMLAFVQELLELS
jgi:hypothetical protein